MTLRRSEQHANAKPIPARSEGEAMMRASAGAWLTPTGLVRERAASRQSVIAANVIAAHLKHMCEAGFVDRAETGFNRDDRPKYKYRWRG